MREREYIGLFAYICVHVHVKETQNEKRDVHGLPTSECGTNKYRPFAYLFCKCNKRPRMKSRGFPRQKGFPRASHGRMWETDIYASLCIHICTHNNRPNINQENGENTQIWVCFHTHLNTRKQTQKKDPIEKRNVPRLPTRAERRRASGVPTPPPTSATSCG